MRVTAAMRNIIDYVETEMNGLEEKPFNPVDSLVLSQLAYLHFDGLAPGLSAGAKPVKIRELLRAEQFGRIFHGVRDEESNKRMLFALAASPRFRGIRMNFYADELDSGQEKQFSAVTFFPGGKTAYLAFRGTDATLIGWKEDFNMAFMSPVPSQEEAVRYVEAVAERFSGRLILGGHSKGGNLAVYAAMKCRPAVQRRIVRIYSHDGPGFRDNVFQSEAFGGVSGRICKTLPQSSLIGMLLENQENYTVVESSRFGLMQHDPFSWAVAEDDFQIVEHLSAGARYMNKTLSDWIGKISSEERERLVDALYTVMAAGNAETVSEFGADWQKRLPAMHAAARNLDAETRLFVVQTLRALALFATKNIPYSLRQNF